MRYAMILKNRVIGIVENGDTVPSWPTDVNGSEVAAVECDDTVKIGMIYDATTNTFSKYIPPARPKTASELVLDIVSKSKEEIENAAIDAYTEELIEGGIL